MAFLDARVDVLIPNLMRTRPLNGQLRRAELFKELAAIFRPAAIIETGTYRGITTEWLASIFGVQVYSIELEPYFFHYSSFRLRSDRRVALFRGDSQAVLRQFSTNPTIPKRRVLFYLDAHWGDDLPLKAELEAVADGWDDSVVIIDDFEVPGDPGYGFDDYGEGRRLSVDYLPSLSASRFWPRADSRNETGFRRGSIILGFGEAAKALNDFTTLRR
jgi:predicted O-methyltransferase YrrM